MKSKMISVVVSIFATTTLLAATVTVEKPAGDGANTLTQEIDLETGDIVSERMTLVHVAPKADTETQKQLDGIKEELRVLAKPDNPDVEKVTAYRIHLYRNADGSEVAYVVGVDGIERPVVLLDPLEYRLLTERLDAVWQSFHSTADGRRKLHGKIERTEIDEKAMQKVEVHADGYRHTEAMQRRERPAAAKLTRPAAKVEPTKPKGMSDKRWEMRQAFKKHRQGVPKQVTVEHDAVTGKDTLLEGK